MILFLHKKIFHPNTSQYIFYHSTLLFFIASFEEITYGVTDPGNFCLQFFIFHREFRGGYWTQVIFFIFASLFLFFFFFFFLLIFLYLCLFLDLIWSVDLNIFVLRDGATFLFLFPYVHLVAYRCKKILLIPHVGLLSSQFFILEIGRAHV